MYRTISLRVSMVAILLFSATEVASAVDSASEFKGAVTVEVALGLGIATSIDIDYDGQIDKIWLLQIAERIPPELPMHLPEARVLVRSDGVVVADAGREQVISMFTSSGRDQNVQRIRSFSDVVQGDSRAKLKPAETLSFWGYGFSEHSVTGWRELSLATWRDLLLEEIETQCHAGGPGARSCSYETSNSRCSTNCDPGSYACCRVISSGIALCSCIPSTNSGPTGGGGFGGGGSGICTNDGSGCPPECMSCTSAI